MSKVRHKKPAVKAKAKKAAKKVATRVKPKKKLSKAKQAALEIAKREKIFKAASPAQKRVLIAKDVIAQIKAKKLKPAHGTFVTFDKVAGLKMTSKDPYSEPTREDVSNHLGADEDARELYLENKIQQCSCCALGSLFVSCTLYNDNTTADELASAGDEISDWLTSGGKAEPMSNGLDKFFSIQQLQLIEQTFETDNGVVQSHDMDEFDRPYPKFSKASAAFCDKYTTAESRMIAIMKNIVANDGTFKP
jgi:hypothetical protein